MARTLAELPIEGRVVIGGEEGSLAHGTVVGLGGRPFDLALDPLEGRGIVARGGNGAMSMIAVGEPGSLVTLPLVTLPDPEVRVVSSLKVDQMQTTPL